MALNTLRFSSIVLTALAMSTGMAHLFALPNKIGLSAGAYLMVQQVYSGWALLGAFIVAALIASALLARRLRHRTGYGPAALAVVCLALGLILFFTFTFPANRATANWTVEPANWDSLRTEWEYSHAAAALLYLAALCLLVWSALSGQPSRDVALFISH